MRRNLFLSLSTLSYLLIIFSAKAQYEISDLGRPY